ncbi:NRDE family protein [bacterium]|nr:NRDE family protein [bacterium]
MCLLLFSYKTHPSHKLVLAANRDEFFDRPTAPAAFWDASPDLLSGRDLRAGGTWLGITGKGRIGAITNYRDPASIKKTAPSRGDIVTNFLLGRETPAEYTKALTQKADQYNGFNLIIGDRKHLYWFSNRGDGPRKLSPGLYGLSNRLLDTGWPKVTRGKEALSHLLSERTIPSHEAFFRFLKDPMPASDEELPDTGVGREWERMLSPIFISSPNYGTRSSTLLFVGMDERVTFVERTFHPGPGRPVTRKYKFQIEH